MIAAFITGHSVRGCTGLSPAQKDFQGRSMVPAECWLPRNFPYHETRPFPERVPLLAASLSNFRHYYASRRPAFRERHREAVTSVFAPHDAVVLLAGSCGLELLANLDLPHAILSKLHVFACGPVSRSVPDAATRVLVQGKRDFISRLYHRRVDHVIDCAHMGYLQAPETLELFNAFCRRAMP